MTKLQFILSQLLKLAQSIISINNQLSTLQSQVNSLTINGINVSGIGSAGDGFVFKNHGAYARDPDTGLYHLVWTYSASGTGPAQPVRGSTGYTFAAIPSTPSYT